MVAGTRGRSPDVPVEALAVYNLLARRGHSPRSRSVGPAWPRDPIGWAQSRFYVPGTGQPIILYPHQQAWLRLALTRREDGSLPYRTLIYSTIKQSGKSTIAGLICRWYAETQQNRSEIYCIGNDQEQAKTRSFREIRYSLELTPGYNSARDRLPGEWEVQRTQMRCLLTGSEIRALAVDARGEAGGKPAVQAWTELWGCEYEDALRFWDELTPIPTVPDSFRIVETYAGYMGESNLLYSLYEQGLAGHQLTAGELARRTGIPYGPPFGAFAEARHPDDPVPIWEDRIGSLLMYWDSGPNARRMPWQQGERGMEYYREQEKSLLPNAYRRLHLNEWVSPESSFITEAMWDACTDDSIPPLAPGDRTPVVLGVDAATTMDCFAVVAVTRHPTRPDDVAVRAVRVFDPHETGGVVDYDEAERFIRFVCQGGHIGPESSPGRVQFHPPSLPVAGCPMCSEGIIDIPGHNVVQITYDPYQLESMMQRIGARDGIAWCSAFPQTGDRLRADRQLYDLILTRRISHPSEHDGASTLRQHLLNAVARIQREDSTMRLVKAHPSRKIDAAVALSMAAARCLYLIL